MHTIWYKHVKKLWECDSDVQKSVQEKCICQPISAFLYLDWENLYTTYRTEYCELVVVN